MSVEPVSNLNRTGAPTRLSAPRTPRERQLKRAADELVGTVFFGEVFKAMRNSTLKGKFGHGGRGEEVFSAQLHEVLAKRMGRSARLGINESLYRRFAGLT